MQLPPRDERSERLFGIFSIIENRVERITRKRPDWLCHKGCDQCCRQLAQPPALTAVEWNLLGDGLAQLDPTLQQQVGERIHALARHSCGPLTCPLLDDASGTCLVYHFRPVMCRIYGFYASGMYNLWCDMLQAKYQAGAYDEVVLGNHAPVQRALQQHGGETRSLVAWYQATSKNHDAIDEVNGA